MYYFTKRSMDILVAAVLIVLLSPLFALVILVLRITGEGEVFYLQKRIGFQNKPFCIYKFATMVKDSMRIGTGSITVRNDPRVTPVGRILRFTKINELPQLLNVLRGDMSLVGPRPFVTATFAAYPEHVQERIYQCMPGLTGLGSIVYRDEEAIISRSELPPAECYRRTIAPHKGELEMWYQNHQSLWVDTKILAMTIVVIFWPSDELVYQVFRGLPRPENAVVKNAKGIAV